MELREPDVLPRHAPASFSLYIHIPYCESKCPYCDFNSYAVRAWPEDEYTDALVSELKNWSEDPRWAGRRVKTIFFGGGTPSLFRPDSIAALIEATGRRFGIEHEAEITLEANPGTVDRAKLEGFCRAGVNRISFGAQSFNPATLRFLGRIHSADQTREAVRLARRAGFESISLDLIFAVPGQTEAEVLFDIEEAAALKPDHISDYNLTFEEGTALYAARKKGQVEALDDDRQAALFALVRQELPARGFRMYEISNYAKPGHESRHNLTYWRAESYLGLGAGAHSFTRAGGAGLRWWNERNPTRYIEAVTRDGRAAAGSESVDEPMAAGEFVFLNLRLREGFALADFSAAFSRSFDAFFGSRVQFLFDGGLLVRDSGRVRLSERGVEVADSVFAQFV